MRAIVTVLGKDKVGIISTVSSILSDSKVNILDISQTILQEYFTMIMLVDLSSLSVTFDELKHSLDEEGKKLDVSIKMQREDLFNSMHNL